LVKFAIKLLLAAELACSELVELVEAELLVIIELAGELAELPVEALVCNELVAFDETELLPAGAIVPLELDPLEPLPPEPESAPGNVQPIKSATVSTIINTAFINKIIDFFIYFSPFITIISMPLYNLPKCRLQL
jgi:hypothetical protein